MASPKPIDYLFWALKQQTNNPIRNLVLIQLCNRAGRDGSCFPSHSTIAKDCGCSVRSVKHHLIELERIGLIAVTRRVVGGMKTSSVYSFPLVNSDGQDLPNDGQDLPKGSAGDAPRRAGAALGVVQEMPIETPIIKHPVKHPIKHTPLPPSEFDDFYEAYPKKVGRADAEKAWKKLNPQPALINRIMHDIVQRVERGHWCTGKDKQFIPGPAPYLNGQKWTDEIIPRPDFKPGADFDFNDVVDLNEVLKIERR